MTLLSTPAPSARSVTQARVRNVTAKVASLEPVPESDDEDSTDAGSVYASESEWPCSSASEDEGASQRGLLGCRPQFRAPPGLTLGMRASMRTRNHNFGGFRTPLETIPGSPATAMTGTLDVEHFAENHCTISTSSNVEVMDLPPKEQPRCSGNALVAPPVVNKPVFATGKSRPSKPSGGPVFATGRSTPTSRSCVTRDVMRDVQRAYGKQPPSRQQLSNWSSSSSAFADLEKSAASISSMQESSPPAVRFSSFEDFARAVENAHAPAVDISAKSRAPISFCFGDGSQSVRTGLAPR